MSTVVQTALPDADRRTCVDLLEEEQPGYPLRDKQNTSVLCRDVFHVAGINAGLRPLKCCLVRPRRQGFHLVTRSRAGSGDSVFSFIAGVG